MGLMYSDPEISCNLYHWLGAKKALLTHTFLQSLKDKAEFWSCDCIGKEKVWNGSEKVDHVACKYWCVLQGSGVIKMIINLAQS